MKIKKFILFLFIIFILLIIIISIYYYNEMMDYEMNKGIDNVINKGIDNRSNKNIIGYIHVCQKGDWTKSYDIIMKYIKKYGLYENINELRIGIVNDTGNIIHDPRFDDNKIKIIYVDKSDNYERPTLLHMKKFANIDSDNTIYFYLHTKGIRHFNTKNEYVVIKWIKDMLYWNIQLWKNAVDKLDKYDTYGCNFNGTHYSGNFWWTTKQHVQKLDDIIPAYYTAPEDWIATNKDNLYCCNNCKDSFISPYPDDFY